MALALPIRPLTRNRPFADWLVNANDCPNRGHFAKPCKVLYDSLDVDAFPRRSTSSLDGAVEVASTRKETPKQELAHYLAKYDPAIARIARAALALLRKRLPGSTEMVYDNYNALAIGFGPGEKVSEAILSIAVYPRWVSLFFLQGSRLKDPAGLLKGSGTRVRHIVLREARDISSKDIDALIAAALAAAKAPIDPKVKRRLIIKSVSAKQRPRRPV